MNMLKRYLPLLAFLSWTGAIAQSPQWRSARQVHDPTEYCTAENNTFEGGEEISYKIYYQLNFIWLPAGRVVFRIEDLGETYKIVCTGRTISAFEWFYKVRDYYETIIDKRTMLPIEFTRDIQEGKYEAYNRFEFDQVKKEVVSYKKRPGKEPQIEKHVLSDCMHDLISIIYYVRNMELEHFSVNDSFPVTLFLEEEFPLNVHVVGKDEVKRFRNMGKYKCHSISPEVIAGYQFREGTEMLIWFTADRNRVPLMIESPVSVGSVKVVLESFRGLKHPFDAVYFEE